MTTTHTTGSKYEATEHLSRVELAKLIRADIADAIKRGILPEGIKVSVRAHRVTYSSGITLTVTKVPADFEVMVSEEEQDRQRAERTPRPWYTRQAAFVEATLERIADAYNYDRSDILSDYFDVRFYLTVGFGFSVKYPGEKAA